MKTKCFGLFAFLFLLPLLGNAQLTYPTVLRNELDQAPIDASAHKLVVLIHGWNPENDSDMYSNPSGPSDTENKVSEEFNALQSNLKLKLQSSGWKLVLYHWEKDASTGPVGDLNGWAVSGPANAVKAARNAYDHGLNLGERLNTSAPDLRVVHFIAHSAGSWAARQAAVGLLQTNKYVSVQVTLLDPYIPLPATLTGNDPTFSPSAMSQLSSASGDERILAMENYYAIDFITDYAGALFERATSQEFSWGVKGLNLRVEWGFTIIPGQYPNYDTHAGPIKFYCGVVFKTGLFCS